MLTEQYRSPVRSRSWVTGILMCGLIQGAWANTPPIAVAGSDQTQILGLKPAVLIDGRGSSDTETPTAQLQVLWTLAAPAGSSAALDDSGKLLTHFLPDVGGTYSLTLAVADGIVAATDDLVVTVIDPAVGPDTDADGLSDVAEAALGTDPALADTDGDGSNDLEELTRGSDPIDPISQPLARIIISELMANNNNTALDEDFYNAEDWVEIRNLADFNIDLGGFYLTDDFGEPTKWRIPDNTSIPANGRLLFWADGEDLVGNSVHTNFSLKQGGEEVALYDDLGNLIDSVAFGDQLTDVSYGRDPLNLSQWHHFDTPTPGVMNSLVGVADFTDQAATPTFDIASGAYASPQVLSLSITAPATEIRYTLDGSIPTASSSLYIAPLDLTQTQVVRARAFGADLVASEVTTSTYLIDEGFTLPVVSISTNPENLWDDTIGIYVKGTNGITEKCVTEPHNWNQDWERVANVEFINDDGTPWFSQTLGVEVFGGCSRIIPQKSLALRARGKFGDSKIRYQLFDDKPFDSYRSVVLRNSGGDNLETHYRDAFMQTLIKDRMDVDQQAYEPMVLILNGEYWGLINLREKINEYYMETNYDLDPDEIDLLEGLGAVREGTPDHYLAMIDYIRNNSLSIPANYAYVQTQMDVDEYINYYLAQIYFGNTDWPNNNIRYWREQTATSRWRWLMFDLDEGFNLTGLGADHDSLQWALDGGGQLESAELFSALLSNADFKRDFMQRFAGHLATTFEASGVIAVIDTLQSELAPEIPKQLARWEPTVFHTADFSLVRVVDETSPLEFLIGPALVDILPEVEVSNLSGAFKVDLRETSIRVEATDNFSLPNDLFFGLLIDDQGAPVGAPVSGGTDIAGFGNDRILYGDSAYALNFAGLSLNTSDFIEVAFDIDLPPLPAEPIAPWNGSVQILRDFANARVANVLQDLLDQWGPTGTGDTAGTALLTIENPEFSRGTVRVSTVDIPNQASFDGLWFQDLALQLEAIPEPGRVFVGWEGAVVSSASTISLTLTGPTLIRAVFADAP